MSDTIVSSVILTGAEYERLRSTIVVQETLIRKHEAHMTELEEALALDKPRAAWAEAITKNGMLCHQMEALAARVKALEEGLTATRRTLTGVVNNLDDPHYRGHIPEGGDYTYVAHEENAHERWVQFLSDAARTIDALLTPSPEKGRK